jgi:hypothetical protein
MIRYIRKQLVNEQVKHTTGSTMDTEEGADEIVHIGNKQLLNEQ